MVIWLTLHEEDVYRIVFDSLNFDVNACMTKITFETPF